MTQTIVIERDGAVLTLRLNRPEKKNALTRDMYRCLATALQQADADASVHAIVLCGSASSGGAGPGGGAGQQAANQGSGA